MESDAIYITVSEAARILDCEVDRIHELLHDHAIRGKREGDLTFVRQEDISELLRMEMIGIRMPELVKRLLFLETKVGRLETSLNRLYEINELSSSRFASMNDRELHELYVNVTSMLKEEEWPIERMLRLCEVFIKITEVEIERLNDILRLDNAWFPFYRLSLELTSYVGKRNDLELNYNLQKVRDLLYVGRKNLQTIAILFIHQKAALGPSRELLAKMAAVDVEAFDVLVADLCPK